MLEEKLDTEKPENTLHEESDTAPVLTESNKMRVFLGIIVGGAIFIGLVISIIVLLANIPPRYEPPKPKPKPNIHSYNPFRIDSVFEEGHKKLRVNLINKRRELEQNITDPTQNPIFQTEPRVFNTTENWEPTKLRVIFEQLDEHLLNVKYEDPQWVHWEPPQSDYDKDPYHKLSSLIKSPLGIIMTHKEGAIFEWSFAGKMADLVPLMNTQDCRLQVFDKYVEFEARLQTNNIYGMGERFDSFVLKNDNYSLWNRDHFYEFGRDSEPGTYGSHPFILNRLRDKKDFIGIFMRNSNAMLFSFWHAMNNGTTINYKMIGGIIDLYVIHEADPDYILKKYHSIIGRPYLPPVWAMGLQQGRRGYDLATMKEVLAKYDEFAFPLDSFWVDIDLNEKYKTFTVDQTKFAGIKEFTEHLHNINKTLVVITTPGLKKETGYKYYEEAVKENCLITSAAKFNQPYEGRTMAGTSVWLDFFADRSLQVWAGGIMDLHDLTGLDGIWITDNEISNKCNGECGTQIIEADIPKIPNPFHNDSEFDYLQYRPTIDPLEANTLPMSAYHQGDIFFNKQYYTHNLYGLQVTKATYLALHGIFEDKRFLVASRSTWPGSGKYGSHWLGDNFASWDSLRGSIPGILNFNMFGIPHVGAPIGGVFGDCEPELLARWYELGSFYPLMLSYSGMGTNNKEPYANDTIRAYIKNALVERYSLIRFMYTKMFESHMWGGAVVHPLFFEFPADEHTYDPYVIDRTFMWGKTLYIIPALIKGATGTRAYLPNWKWYNLQNFEIVKNYVPNADGEMRTFDQPLGQITMLIKGGTIFPYQMSIREARVMNVEDLKKIPALIIVAPDHTGRAQGTMVVDTEGIKPHPDPNSNTYRHYAFTYMNQIFRINKLAGFDFVEKHMFDYFWELIILDTSEQQTVSFTCMMDLNHNKKELLHWRSANGGSLVIYDIAHRNIPMFDMESIIWGTAEQHDFCQYQVHATQISYPNDKTMNAVLETSDQAGVKVKLDLQATILTDQIVSMQISKDNPGKTPFIVPGIIDDNVRRTSKATKTIQESGFRISKEYEPFFFEMSDPTDTHDFTFTTRNMNFVYLDNYIHFKFMANTRHIFGLGERVGKFELQDGLYSMFNYDQVSEETGVAPGNNMYGSHPFYIMQMQNPHLFAGVFFLNSNPIDVKIRHVGMQTQIDHIFVGGIIDAFFLQRNSPEELTKSYQYLIGHPTPLPYWAFGYHQSRWGYRDIKHLEEVVMSFNYSGIPLDAVWMDKDYMKDYKVFTVDKQNWYGLSQFIEKLHSENRHFVAIVDPGVAIDGDYSVYITGRDQGVFIKSGETKDDLIGITWPGYSVWVDFLNPAALKFWEDQLLSFYVSVQFDGLWLDMNEPSNFCDGECPDEKHYNYYNFPLDFYDDLFYNPTHRPLEKGTISMEAVHHGGGLDETEFNYHNLYGLLQSRATAQFFRTYLHKRPFIISSSTFPSIGRYAAHWLGDNFSSWHYMEYSIAGMLNFQLFGIPFVGADICGYEGNSTVNLCSRWMQLGAFYPFMRNHNSPNGKPQEPYTNKLLEDVSKKAIFTRYSLSRYLYSNYMKVVVHGGMLIKPILFDFPADHHTFNLLDTTFMFGHALRVDPVLSDNTGSMESYFPNHDWYELNKGFKHVVAYNHSTLIGKNITMACSLDTGKLNLHIKGGSIFSYQDDILEGGAQTIDKMRDRPIKLIVVPDHNLQGSGFLFYDEDDQLNINDHNYEDFILTLSGSELKIKLDQGNRGIHYPHHDNEISEIVIVNSKVFMNQIVCAKLFDNDLKRTENLEVKQDGENTILLAKSGYKMIVNKIDQVNWYNHTEC